MAAPRPVALLCTDLVDSPTLLQRAGDEGAQRLLRAHRQVVREAVAHHRGRELAWPGDGLLATFTSVAEGVRCAVTMAQRARSPVGGERLQLRLGLHVGEWPAGDEAYLNPPVVVTRRLCDRARAGQILCTSAVVELLRERRGFDFVNVGLLQGPGLAEPLAVFEASYRLDAGQARLGHTPVTGRAEEFRRLKRRLEGARSGQGAVVLLAGEPGIGKTRMLEEVAETARSQGAVVLWGRCYEGEAARPFGPFVEALGEYARTAAPEVLRADLGASAGPLTRLLPELRVHLADLPEPDALEPYEERVRLLDAVAQVLLALAARVPTILVLDDLHWADPGTVALLRHVARFAPRGRLVVFFFLHEVLLHLAEEGVLVSMEGEWRTAPGLSTLLPETVRQVIARRIARLSDAARRFLQVAAAFAGGIDFEVARQVAGLAEAEGLDALDSALGARLLVPSAEGTAGYDFAHALIRHTLYGDLSPSRQVRLHRRRAEEMARRYGEDEGMYTLEIARQWHRSAALPGAERGVGHCLVAAERAERAAAHEDAAATWRMALDLLRPGDPRRARILARLGLALTWSRAPEDAVRLASEAGELLAATEGDAAAADYLAEVAEAVYSSSSNARAWALAEQGLRYIGCRRDPIWALLTSYDLEGRDARDPAFPGVPLDVPERHEAHRILLENPPSWERFDALPGSLPVFASREDVLRQAGRVPAYMAFYAGEYARASAMASEAAVRCVERGQLAVAALDLGIVAQCQSALGNLHASHEAFARAHELADRIGNPSYVSVQLQTTPFQWVGIRGEGYEFSIPGFEGLLASANAPEVRWLRAGVEAGAALVYAHAGRDEDARRAIAGVLPAIERGAGWAISYTLILYGTIEAVWVLASREPIEVLERNLRSKTLAADFRCQHTDARLALARLCALTARSDEAREWLDEARRVLDEQGARPLRAIVDYDEALMEARRGTLGDGARARALLDSALRQFRAIDMPGWVRRAEALSARLADCRDAAADRLPQAAAPVPGPDITGVFRREGDVWAVTYAGRTVRLRDARGLGYLTVLLRHPGRDLHAIDVVRLATGDLGDANPSARSNGELSTSIDVGHADTRLDARAGGEYRARLLELRDELAEAEGLNDLGRATRLREEIDALVEQLTSAAGGRTAASPGERARLTVIKGTKSALERIAASHPELGRHLAATVHRGYFCVYRPDPVRPVQWDT